MEDNKPVADNYECANALEHYKQKFLAPLGERVKKNYEFIFEGGYDKQCKDAGVDPDPKKVESMKKGYDEIFFQYNEGKLLYTAAFKLTQRHEAVIDELARIYKGIQENIVFQGEIPPQLMKEQCDMLKGYYRSMAKILATIKIDSDEK